MIIKFIFLLVVTTKCFFFSKNLWIYSDKPIKNSSLLVQLQYQRIEHLQNTLLKKFVTLNDAQKYLRHSVKHQGTILKNILKLNILNKFGGVWIQLSGILIEDINWLSELDNNKDVTKHSGSKPHVFAFAQSLTSMQQIFDGQLTLQTSFIASINNNLLIQQTLQVYMDMLQKGEKVTGYKTTKDQNVAKLYDDDDQLILVQAFRRVLNPKDKNIDRFELWTINADEGPTQYLSRVNWTQSRIVSFLSTVRGQKVNKYKKSRYYARMRQHETEMINLFLGNLTFFQRAKLFIKGYREGQVMNILCGGNSPFLLTNSSVIGTYLFTYNDSLRQKFEQKFKVRRADYNYPCDIKSNLGENDGKTKAIGIIFVLVLLHPFIVKILIKILQLWRKYIQRKDSSKNNKSKKNEKYSSSAQMLQLTDIQQA